MLESVRNSWVCKQTILTARRHSKKLPKNRDVVSIYSNLVVRLVKSWATRDVRKHFEQQTSTKVLDFVACLR